MNGNGPLSPDELARVQSYWSTPALSSSAAQPAPAAADYFGPPPAAPAPGPEPAAFGPPPAPPGPAPLPEPPGALVSPTSTQSPEPEPIMSGGPVRQPGAIEREQPNAAVFGPPVAREGFAGSNYAKSHKATGGAPNADAFGVKKAQQGLLGTYEDQKASMGREGVAAQDAAVMQADQMKDLARLKEEDAAIAHETEQRANDRFEAHMAETQRQLDDVRAKKIDPGRYMRDTSGFLAVLGGVMGGMYMGINKLDHNPFLDDLNKQIDRDIDAQKTDLANQREGVSNRMSMLGQMRSVYKDHTLAELQARNLYYESAKEKLTADASRADSAIAKEHNAQAITTVDRAQKQLDVQIKEAARHEAMTQAAAAAAQARAARKEAFENTTKLIELGQKDKQLDIEGRKVDVEKGEKITQQTQALGKELSDEKITGARKTIDDLKKKLANPQGEVDGSKRIPGVGPAADNREELFPGNTPGAAKNMIPGYGIAHYYGKLTPEERVGKQEWNRLFDAYKVSVTGAGASEGEIENLRKSFSGANTPAEQAAAVRLADEMLSERETRIKAGVPKEVADYYGQRVTEEKNARPKTVPRKPVD